MPAMSEALKLQLPSSIQYLETIIDTAEVFFERNRVSSKLIGYLVASLTEAASNAIIHGNDNQVKKNVYVNLDIEEDQIRLSVEDSNDVFEDFVTDNDGPESLLSTSGRGIFIIKTYMDDVSVSKGDYGTKVMMKKRYR